jgi:hypothetical protein
MSIDTVNDLSPRVQYTATAAQTTFPYPFPIFADADLVVDIDGVTQALTTDYTVSGAGDDTGGDVTLLVAATGGEIVTIYRDIAIARATDFQQNGPLASASFNDELDKVYLLLQQLESRVNRGLRLPITSGATDAQIEFTPIANWLDKFVYIDSNGLPQPGAAVTGETLSRTTIASYFLPLSAAEIAAGLTTSDITQFWPYGDIRRYKAVCDGATDDTARVQLAIDVAHGSGTGNGNVFVPSLRVAIFGTLDIKSGVAVRGESHSAEYYINSPFSTIAGAQFYKPTGGTDGSMVVLQTGSSLSGVYLRWDKVGGATQGIVRFGDVDDTSDCYNASLARCAIYGNATTDVGGTTTCVGIKFPDADTGTDRQRYFNRVTDLIITNCDIAIELRENCNANVFTGIVTRSCYWHYNIDGGAGQAVENVFAGIQLANIGTLPTTPSICFRLRDAEFNVFSGFTTECNGSAFDLDSTAIRNVFLGTTNETTSSVVPVGNTDLSQFAVPVNRDQSSSMLLPNQTDGTRFTQGQGNHVEKFALVTGTLPELNGSAIAAADADSKVIVTFDPGVYIRSARPNMMCRLQVFLNAPGGGAGEAMADVRFWYRPTDNASSAASLSVISVDKRPSTSNYIIGLDFLSGKAAATGFKIALTGGNFGAFAASHVIVRLEVTVLTHTTNQVAMADYANITFASAACTANDVTDAISLLTVADTTITA